MKILFLAPRFPRPPYKGDQARAAQQLRLLRQKHDITLLALADQPVTTAERDAAQALCSKLVVIARTRASVLNLLRGPLTRLPLQTLLYASHGYAAAVDRELRQNSFDIVHAQLIRMWPYVENVRGIPRVIDLIDSMALNMSRRAAGDTPLLRPVVHLEARRSGVYERRICHQVEAAVVVSPVDRAAIGDYPNLHVVPIGVDPEALNLPPQLRERDLIVFTGTMNYFPNIEAAGILIREILPLVRKSCPSARVQIVGANPAKSVRQLAAVPGVEVTGSVPEIFPYLQRASVAVSPMRFGSRTQFKLLEPMAVSTPVVTTMAEGGLDIQNGVHVLVGNDSETIAAQIVRVLRDPDLAERLGRAGAQLVREKFTQEASVAALERVYESVAGARAD